MAQSSWPSVALSLAEPKAPTLKLKDGTTGEGKDWEETEDF